MNFKPVQWMRLVLPRFDMVMVFVIIVLTVDGLWLSMIWKGWDPAAGPFFILRLAVYVAMAAAYGYLRASTFHPAANEDYCRWLENTPWTVRHPLPAGPITLVIQDLVVILLLMGLSQEMSLRCLYIPVAFLSAYQLNLAFLNWRLNEWALAYAVGLGLGAQCFFLYQPQFQFPIAVACYPLTRLGVQRTLERFPWPRMKSFKELVNSLSEESAQDSLGWPYDALAPRKPQDVISRHDAICLPCLIGWWQLAILWGSEPKVRLTTVEFTLMFAVIAPLFRVAIYAQRYRSPIDLWGRLRIGRLIIPGYDCIWVGTIVAYLVGLPLYFKAIGSYLPFSRTASVESLLATNPALFNRWELSLAPLSVTLMLLALFLIGPGLQRWQMTGTHRVVFPRGRKDFIEL